MKEAKVFVVASDLLLDAMHQVLENGGDAVILSDDSRLAAIAVTPPEKTDG